MNNTPSTERSTRAVLRIAAALAMTAAMAGCAVTPTPLSNQQIADRVAGDKSVMYANQEPIRGPISLSEASARAIKYNLDYRLKIMEEALARGQLDVTTWDMFPRLLLNAGYVNRSNELAYITAGGIPSTTTLDRSRRLASAEFSWNILDFGASYYRARMAADQTLVAEERKRKAIQNIMQDVRTAYWRALGAQRLMAQMDGLMGKSKIALARARQIEQQGLLPQAQALAYQRALLDSTVLLQVRRQDLELAKTELAALMNLEPGASFMLVDTAEPILPPTPNNVDQLEELALNQRPELREEDYKKRISVNDAKRALMSTLPGLTLDFSKQYDSNKFLLNNSWVESGLRLSMNLFRLASIPTLNRQRDAQLSVDDTRRMAQAMAALTQVRVATQRYGLAKEELEQVADSANVDQRLANYAKAAASSRVDSELEVIRTEARALLSSYQRHVAYANAQAAYGRVFNSIGLDVKTPPPGADVATIMKAVEESVVDWSRVTFQRAAAEVAPLPNIAIVIENVKDPKFAAAIREGATQALNRYKIQVTDDPNSWKMVVNLSDQAQGASRRASWNMILMRPNGTKAGQMTYSSVIPGDMPASSVNALTQSAIDSYSVAMTDWLGDPNRNIAKMGTATNLQ